MLSTGLKYLDNPGRLKIKNTIPHREEWLIGQCLVSEYQALNSIRVLFFK